MFASFSLPPFIRRSIAHSLLPSLHPSPSPPCPLPPPLLYITARIPSIPPSIPPPFPSLHPFLHRSLPPTFPSSPFPVSISISLPPFLHFHRTHYLALPSCGTFHAAIVSRDLKVFFDCSMLHVFCLLHTTYPLPHTSRLTYTYRQKN